VLAWLCCLPLLFCTGCWDAVELQNRGFVLSIAIDRGKKAEDHFIVHLTLPNVAALANQDGESKKDSVKTASGPTLAAAMKQEDSLTSEKITIAQAKLVILALDVLHDETMLRETLDYLERNQEVNRRILLMATTSNTKKVLAAKTTGNPMLGLYIAEFYKTAASGAGATFRQDLDKFLFDMENGCGLLPVIIAEKDDDIKIGGSVLVTGGKAVKTLNEQETRGYLWARAACQGAVVSSTLDGQPTAFAVSSSKGGIALIPGDQPQCLLTAKITGSWDEQEQANLPAAQQELTEQIATEITRTTDIFQENHADAYGLREIMRKHHPREYMRIEDWNSWLDTVTYTPVVSVWVTGMGRMK